jgi:hypothetical protein
VVAPFIQSQSIRDYVFPLVELDLEARRVHRFRGTGFFLGSRNYALTAGHVVQDLDHHLAALLVQDGHWIMYDIETATIGHHPTEDIAVITVEPPSPTTSWRSTVSAVSSETVHGSSHYYLFGYPEDAAYEIVRDDRAQVRPDLVYSEGHVRRRIAGVPLPKIRGTVFLELSGVAGGGCSGSPVFKPGRRLKSGGRGCSQVSTSVSGLQIEPPVSVTPFPLMRFRAGHRICWDELSSRRPPMYLSPILTPRKFLRLTRPKFGARRGEAKRAAPQPF